MQWIKFSLLSCLLMLAAACPSKTGRSARAPDFILNTAVDARPTRLSAYTGKKVVLLNFWATWCGPCMQELPHLQAIYEKYKDQGFEVVSVAMDGPESAAAVAPVVRRAGLTFPVLLDTDGKAVGLYNPTRAQPFSVFIDRSGKIVGSKEGFSAGDEKELEATVVALLGQASPIAATP